MENCMPKTEDEIERDKKYDEFWSRFVSTKYIAFDLDGTLAKHEPGESTDQVGEPIQSMVELARAFLAGGRHVRVVTARAWPGYSDYRDQVAMIGTWLEKHVTHDMPYEIIIQSHKCGRMELLYDDRAIGVLRNEGQLKTMTGSDFLGLLHGRNYDEAHGEEFDARAEYVSTEDAYPIRLDTGVAGEPESYLDLREAKCLLASLTRAIAEADVAEAERKAAA